MSKGLKSPSIVLAALLAGVSIASAQDVPPAAPVETVPVEATAQAVPVAPVARPAESASISVGGTKVSLYGFFQLNGIYEDGANGGQNWSTYVKPNAEDGEGRLLLNVNQTRIGVNVAGPPKESGAEISGRFESDFANSNDKRYANGNTSGASSFRIRQAFGQLKFNDIGLSLLFGQTSDVIAPLVAPSLNQGALQGQGSLGTRRPMVRLAQALGPVEITAAATDNRDIASPTLPAFQGSLKGKLPASWAGEKQNIELILSGHYASRELAAETKAEKEAKKAADDPASSWSGTASLSLPVISVINLSGELFYGQNLSSYNVGSIGQSGTAKDGKSGLQSLGGWGAANIKLPANFALAGGVGIESIDKDREPAKGRIKNSVIFANLKYFVAESAFVGLEYANLSTDYVDNEGEKRETDSGKLNRVEFVFNYSFK